MRKARTPLLCAVLGLAGLAPAGATSHGERPNIVFILADDVGYGDMASYGHPYARTPNLDRLAAEGTRFEQAYVTASTCWPSRTGLMTGKFHRAFPRLVLRYGSDGRLTVTELLKQNGYRTGHFGKWHIGPTTEPGTYGIDEIVAVERRTWDGRGRDAPIFDAAIDFIERNRDVPFYVNVWGYISHFPVKPPRSYLAGFKDLTLRRADFSDYMQEKFDLSESKGADLDEAMRDYVGSILSLDDEVGRLLAKLDELDLRDNTIVVFSSDNGPAPNYMPAETRDRRIASGLGIDPRPRVNMLGYAGGLRGGKLNHYEGGVRVPFIIRWPGHVPAGRVDTTSVISGADWLPTLAAITSSRIDGGDLDGEDVTSAWLGKAFTRSKPLFWSFRSPRAEVAMRDEQWKLHLPGARGGVLELYDLGSDPGERNNLAEELPEVVARLRRMTEAWRSTLPDKYDSTADGGSRH